MMEPSNGGTMSLWGGIDRCPPLPAPGIAFRIRSPQIKHRLAGRDAQPHEVVGSIGTEDFGSDVLAHVTGPHAPWRTQNDRS